MKIRELERLGVAPAVVDAWRRDFGDDLLPAQSRAVEEGGVLDVDGNVLIVSPTCSGKTAIAELAAVKAAQAGKHVFYVVPHRSLADEKHRELEARYGPIGLQVVVSSRDRREHDDAIAERRFHIAIIVVEKLRALLIRHPSLVPHVGLVIADEVQMLGWGTRGATLEWLVAVLARARLIALSAVVGDPGALAEALHARLVVDGHRPVELRKGTLCRGIYRAREHNSGAKVIERFEDHSRGTPDELIAHVAKELVQRDEQVLVFVPDRRRSVALAHLLGSLLDTGPCAPALADLEGRAETVSRRSLRGTLSRSVAFHNADLAGDERAVVERHFRSGAVRAVVATSTLATGVNLPAQNVIIDPRRWRPCQRTDRWTLDRLSRAEYENMSGRAGRLCGTAKFGRSILVTTSPFDAQVWEKQFIRDEFPPVVPRLQFMSLEDAVLDLVAVGHRTREEMEQVLLATYSGQVRWRRATGELRRAMDAAFDGCLRGGLLERDGKNRFRATPLGTASAVTGVGFASSVSMADWARMIGSEDVSPLEALLVTQLSSAARDIHIALAVGELRTSRHRDELARRASEAGVGHRPVIARLLGDARRWETWEERAVKRVLLLLDHRRGTAIEKIEEQYGVWAGALQRIINDSRWLLRGLAEISSAVGWAGHHLASLRRLGDALAERAEESRPAQAPDTEPAPKTLPSARMKGESNPSRAIALVLQDPTDGLLIDLRKPRVRYLGHEIRTVSPHHIQRLPLLAFAALANRQGYILSMSELASEMRKLGGVDALRGEPVGPDTRYKILRPIRLALAGKIERGDIDCLIETVRDRGLRLNPNVRLTLVTGAVDDAEPRSAA